MQPSNYLSVEMFIGKKSGSSLYPEVSNSIRNDFCDYKKNKFPPFTVGSIYSTNVSGAGQIPETNNLRLRILTTVVDDLNSGTTENKFS